MEDVSARLDACAMNDEGTADRTAPADEPSPAGPAVVARIVVQRRSDQVMADVGRPGREVVVAPEVAARILAFRAAGGSLSEITGCLHLTPAEARTVFCAGPDAPEVAPQVRAPRPVAEMLLAGLVWPAERAEPAGRLCITVAVSR